MEKDTKEALQVSKEIVVKFIETGRVSPANFAEVFPQIYKVVQSTMASAEAALKNSAEAALKNSAEAALKNGAEGASKD